MKRHKTPYQLVFEIKKNIKILLRNWNSLLLLILAPLFLILLAGYTFSSDTPTNINIGVISSDHQVIEKFQKEIISFSNLKEYASVENCVANLIIEKNHLCIEIKGNIGINTTEGIPSGEIIFYYDNTRKRISLLIISELKEYFGLTSEKISLVSAGEVFNNLQNLIEFINDRMQDIEQVRNESQHIKQDLIKREMQLIETERSFTPKYLLIKQIQKEIHSHNKSLSNNTESLLRVIEDLNASFIPLEQALHLDDSFTIIENNTHMTISLSQLIKQTNNRINKTRESLHQTLNQSNSVIFSIDETVKELENINFLLHDEINRTQEYILLIDKSILQIETTEKEAKEKLGELTAIDSTLAAKIIKPLTQTFEPILEEAKEIQVAFPLLLSTILIFISILFSNIITSLEINNKAYYRNILAPVNDSLYTMGIAFTNFIVVIFQVAILLLVAQTSFSVDVVSGIWSTLPIISIVILIFIFLGMIIAYSTKQIQSSILMATFTALGLFLISDVISAVETMPHVAARMAMLNPATIANSMFRKLFFFNVPLKSMITQIFTLLTYLLIALIMLMIVSKKKNKERL